MVNQLSSASAEDLESKAGRKVRINFKIAFFHLFLHVALVVAVYLMITVNIKLQTYLWSKNKTEL